MKLAALPPLAALALAAACGSKPAPLTMQQVMFQVETELGRTQLAVTAGDLPGVATHAASLRLWWNDPAHDRYIASGKITQSLEGFRSLRAELSTAIDELEAAARAGDAAAVMETNARLRSTCDRCHVTYRPLVTKRYGS